jgi:hypothetical protein
MIGGSLGTLPRTLVLRFRAPTGDPGFLMSSDNENIIELLGPGEVIGQAIELLMAERDVDRDGAFAILVQGSADSHERVREVASTIVRQRSAASDS